MKLFDEHIVLRFSFLFASLMFAAFLPDILNFSENIWRFIPYFASIIFLTYVALFYKFPSMSLKNKKIRDDVEIPEPKIAEPSRDYQKDLHEKDEIFQMMVDVSTDGFWTFDVASGKVYWSNRVAELLGVDPVSMGDSFDALKDRISERDWEIFREKLRTALQNLGNFSCSLTPIDTSKKKSSYTISGRVQCNDGNLPIRVIGTMTEVADVKTAETQGINAYEDPLTGIYNRKYFLEKLKMDVDLAAKRPHYVFAVALLDIDSFGAINASYSINTGDNVLRVVADRIKSLCRPDDFVARIGADVFAVVLHNIQSRDPNDDLIPIVRNLHNKVKSPITVEERELYISVSMSVVINQDVDCVEDILANANASLRDMKKGINHGGIQFFSGGIREKAMRLYKLEFEIRRAIQAQEFVLMYQPIVDITDRNKIVAFEALVRWNRSEHGIISPAEFIPIAEETGLIVPMGALILRMACRQTKQWVDMGYKDIQVAVNFSAKQFSMDNMVDDVRQVLAETNLNPRNLKLEITEYTAMCEADKTIEIMRALSNMGIQISIDDFGTGYSSLSYLKRYPVHTLKMDKYFVDHVADNEEDAAFAKMVIGIAKSLNLSLIAEGVESEEQLDFLRREGCKNIQGYYFSKPLSPENALKYMEEHYDPKGAVEMPRVVQKPKEVNLNSFSSRIQMP